MFFFVNCSTNWSSVMIGMPNCCAFLFLVLAEAASLLIRKDVLLLTLPVTLPPCCSM